MRSYVDTSAISKEVITLNRFGRQAVIALMLVGLVIGSAIVTAGIAIGSMQGDFWVLIIRIAVISYIFASIARRADRAPPAVADAAGGGPEARLTA